MSKKLPRLLEVLAFSCRLVYKEVAMSYTIFAKVPPNSQSYVRCLMMLIALVKERHFLVSFRTQLDK